ncbi:MAG: hypothetical protein COA47_12410 [Robiginitomaculum sp.]|nr:MAG: hypothetical protein COA47_12410 [Robiginitomaculum sp.]
MQAFLNTCCTRAWHVEHDRGRSMADGAALLIPQFPHWETQIRNWKDRWADMFAGPVTGMDVLLNALAKAGHPLYALTNMPAEVMPLEYRLFPFLRLFRDIIVSGDEGLLKPDPALFELTLDRMNCRAEQVFFIDDVAENVDVARQLGMSAHLFVDAQTLIVELQKRNVTF